MTTTSASNNNDENNNNNIELESEYNFKINPNALSTGLFDCHEDRQLCLETTFCLPCALSTRIITGPFHSSTGCLWWVSVPLVTAFFPICLPFFGIQARTDHFYVVTWETSWVDYLIGGFCPPCSLAQIWRERVIRDKNPKACYPCFEGDFEEPRMLTTCCGDEGKGPYERVYGKKFILYKDGVAAAPSKPTPQMQLMIVEEESDTSKTARQ